MKHIFLIGDSIRHGIGTPGDGPTYGYGYHMQKKLEGRAKVYSPDDNSRFVHYTLRYLHDWAKAMHAGEDVDIVHWNNGLWDILHIMGDEETFTPLDQYGETLLRIEKRIRRLFPRAKVYFSLTTPAIEEQYTPDFRRYNKDIEAFNQKAIDVLTPCGVEIIDLYSKAKTLQPTYSRDWVHYTPEGASILADYIISQLDL